jgi:hypothetical protein
MALAADVALADSIVYTKNGDIFLAVPDGSREFQVSNVGGFSDPTQADDGTIVATRSRKLYRMNRFGELLNEPIDVLAPFISSFGSLNGPYDPAVSPDGSKVAYWFIFASSSSGARDVVAYTYSDRFTSADEFELRRSNMQPSWFSNDRTMMHSVYSYPAKDVRVDTAQRESAVTMWFSDDRSVEDLEMTRQMDKVAGVYDGAEGKELRFYRATGAPPPPAEANPPQPVCRFIQPVGGKLTDPTWSPDGGSIAWAEGDGIWAAPSPKVDDGSCAGDGPRRILEGGTNPDWGPADVPTARPDLGGPDPTDNTGLLDGTDAAPVIGAALARGARLGPQFGVNVTTNEAGTAVVEGFASGKAAVGVKVVRAARTRRVARGRKALTAPGTHRVVVKFTKKAKRKYRRYRRLRLTLRISVTDAAGNTSTQSGKVTLRR